MGKRGRPPHPDILTPREWQVLDLIRQDLTNEQIAHRLDISPATAKYHVSEILSKLGVQTREEAAVWQPVPAPASDLYPRRLLRRLIAPLTLTKAAIVAMGITMLVGLGVWALNLLPNSSEADSEASRPHSPEDTGTPSIDTPTPDQATPSVVQRPLGQVLVPLANTTVIGDEGSYLVDTESDQIWKAQGLASWSPDGTRFVRTFCCSGERGMDVVDVATGNATRISDLWVSQSAWSPDGSKIAFSNFNGSSMEGVYLINLDGTGFRKLAESSGTGFLSWSFSGDFILAVSPPTGGIAQLITVESGETKTWTEVEHAAWSPTTNTIALASSSGLRLMDATSGDENLVVSGQADNILWSPNGNQLIIYRQGPYEVVSINPPANPVSLPSGRFFSWSPDGTRIAYISEGCLTTEWRVYTVAPDGSNVTPISQAYTVLEGLSWLSDGVSVAYSTGDSLQAANVDSGGERVLATVSSEAAGFLHFHEGLRGRRFKDSSPDGRYVVFGTSIGGHGICT